LRTSHATEKLLAAYLLYATWGLSKLAKGASGTLSIYHALSSAPDSVLVPVLHFAGGVAPLAPLLALTLIVWCDKALRRPEDEELVFPVLLGAVVLAKVLTWAVYLAGVHALNLALMAVG
jgi:hypothetical protein